MGKLLILFSIAGSLVVGFFVADVEQKSSQAPVHDSGRFRPNSVALDEVAQKLVVASDNGEIAVVDANSLRLLSRTQVGKQLSDVKCVKRGDSVAFLVADQQSNNLIQFHLEPSDSAKPVIDWTIEVSQFPTNIATKENPDLIAVACKWSRKIDLVAPPSGEQPANIIKSFKVDFVPGKMKWMPNDKNDTLFIVDAFGNKHAFFSTSQQDFENEESPITYSQIPDRRVGGFDIAQGQFVLATQMLNPLARSTRNDVHWGLMVSNNIESFTVEEFLSDEFNFSKDRSQIPVGGAGEAKSDPEAIIVTPSSKVVMALGGANQVAIGDLNEMGFAYVFVGARPIAMTIDAKEKFCYVANQLDGSISLIDLPEMEVTQTIEIETNKVLTATEQGERHFFDASLSHDGWMSCHSCHVNGHTSGLINDNLSDSTFGTPKRVLSLLGHGDTEPMSWVGSNETLEDQIRKSIEVTMQGDDRPTEEMVSAIAAYVNQLEAPPSRYFLTGDLSDAKIEKGREVFRELECNTCHVPPKFTSAEVYDVGLVDEKGRKLFNPPSLIGLGQRDLFMHDGRVTSLEEVFGKIGHQIPNSLPDEKLSNLLAFLKSL